MKIILVIIFIIVFALPVLLAVWLWYFHNRHIKRINQRISDIPMEINENNRGRGITTEVQERQIKEALKPLENELKIRELNKKLFLDFANLLVLFKFK